MDSAALEIQKVHADVLSDSMKGIYTTICNNTGVTGIEGTSDGEQDTGTGDNSSEAGAGEEDIGMSEGSEGDYSDENGYSGEDGGYEDGSDYGGEENYE